jgi:hypothetical protein
LNLDFKGYQVLKVKNSIRKDSLLIFSDGVETNPKIRISISLGLKIFKAKAYKISNSMARKAIKRSITEKHVQPMIFGGVCCILNIKQDSPLIKKSKVLVNLSSLFFTLLAIKINYKFYSVTTIQDSNSLEYRSSTISCFEFFGTACKFLIFSK